MNETISEVITYLGERGKLFYYYVWDIDRADRRGVDGELDQASASRVGRHPRPWRPSAPCVSWV
jgi:hypothetical protein